MISGLSQKLTSIFNKLVNKGVLTKDDIEAGMQEVKIALVEADVALPVVKAFIEKITDEALGERVLKDVQPGHLIIKLVQDELTKMLGEKPSELNITGARPSVFMMVGLQGSGKTTSTAKLALFLKGKHKKNVLLASLDTIRPAAQEQLAILADQIQVDNVEIIPGESAIQITERALKQAKAGNYDILILDTAGRLHIDDKLMQELEQIKTISKAKEILLVADAMTGQDAVNIADQFNKSVGITGIILTRLDGDTKGGAALSMTYMTGCAIKFSGTGEKPENFEIFQPERIASRILDKGDIVSLVEKAMEAIPENEARGFEEIIKEGRFNFNDFRSFILSINKMGGVGKIMSFLPGVNNMPGMLPPDATKDFTRWLAIINSMTKKERKFPRLVYILSRKERIAKGAGYDLPTVNTFLREYERKEKMIKKLSKIDINRIKNQFDNVF